MSYICLTNGATSGEPLEVRQGVLTDIAVAERDNWRQAMEVSSNIDNLAQVQTVPSFEIQPDTTVQMRWGSADYPAYFNKEALRNYAASKRWRHMAAGTMFNGIPIQTNDQALSRLDGALKALERGAISSVNWKTATGSVVLNLATMEAIFDHVSQFVQACYDEEFVVQGLIDDGTYTTTAQIDGHNWPA